MLTHTLRTAEFSRQLEEIVRVTGKEAGQVIREEGKLFVQDVAHMTPPFGSAPSTESYAKQRKVGEAAVERDIKRVFHVIDLTKIRNEKLRESLEKLIKKRDLLAVELLLRAARIPARAVIKEADPSLHEVWRDRRGRVQSSKFIWVLEGASVGRYIRSKKAHVGLAKSGWAAAAAALGVKLPGWITRHGSGQGSFVDKTNDPVAPKIVVRNGVPAAQATGAELRIVERALKNRVRNMKAKLERVARSGWKKK